MHSLAVITAKFTVKGRCTPWLWQSKVHNWEEIRSMIVITATLTSGYVKWLWQRQRSQMRGDAFDDCGNSNVHSCEKMRTMIVTTAKFTTERKCIPWLWQQQRSLLKGGSLHELTTATFTAERIYSPWLWQQQRSYSKNMPFMTVTTATFPSEMRCTSWLLHKQRSLLIDGLHLTSMCGAIMGVS